MTKTEFSVKTAPGLAAEIGSTTAQPGLQIEAPALRDPRPSSEPPLTRQEIIYDLLKEAVKARHDYVSRNVRFALETFLSFGEFKVAEETLNGAVRGSIQKLKEHLNNKDEAWVDIRISDLIWLLKQMLISSCVEDFLHVWASETELIGKGYRQLNNVTAHVLEVIGKAKVKPSEEVAMLLMKNWMLPLCDDLQRMKGLDWDLNWNTAGEGLSITILSLPVAYQQEIMLVLTEYYVNSGIPSFPNITRLFETWWRKTSLNS